MSTTPPTLTPAALQGVRVIEMGQLIAGPFAGKTLGEFGADVIKIEAPGAGDPLRNWRLIQKGTSVWWQVQSRNKRSIALDLRNPEGQDIARQLIAEADVLIENFRPGTLEAWGMGWDELQKINPGLVMLRISGYGQTGPYAARPGYGAVCEAVGGVRHMTGDPDRPPARVALATTDYLSAVYAAFGAMAALHERQRSGLGQVVDVALYEAAFTQMEPVVPAWDKLGEVPKREGPNLPSMAPNSAYPTRDGAYVLIAANSQPTWQRLVAAMARPELLEDPRFATIRARGVPEHMKALDGIVGQWTCGFDADALQARLHEAEVPCTRVYTIADIARDPQYAAREMLLQVPHPTLGHTLQAGIVPRLSATPGRVRHTGPEPGADTDAVRREIAPTATTKET